MRLFRKGSLRRRIILIAVIVLVVFTLWTLRSDKSQEDLHEFQALHTQQASHICKSCDKHSTTLNFRPPKVSFGRQSHQFPGHLEDISVAYQKKWIGFPDISGTDCGKAFKTGTKNSLYPQNVNRVFPAEFITDSTDCQVFIEKYGFARYPEASTEETSFPIAFIILFHKDLDQIVFLLRAIYRWHNVYCLTMDTKAPIELLEAVRSVAKCLPNVFVSSKLENIVYSGFTRLKADINCLEDLVQHPVQWKYAINLPGQQFPLRTNLELVKILETYNGANDIEGISGDRMLPPRFKYKHRYTTDEKTGEVKLVKTQENNAPPPHGLEIIKGSAYGTFSRAFVQFVVGDQVAHDFLEWSKSVSSPDEYFWSTLHHSKILNVPGAYTAGPPDNKPWISTYASWGGRDPCATIRTRSICIFSPEDLAHLSQRHELFANKFYITHQPAALHCLDQLLVNLTFSGTTRDLTYYRELPFVLKANSSKDG